MLLVTDHGKKTAAINADYLVISIVIPHDNFTYFTTTSDRYLHKFKRCEQTCNFLPAIEISVDLT